MLFLFRSAPEVEKRIHSKLFRKFWRSRGTKEPAYITVLQNWSGIASLEANAVETGIFPLHKRMGFSEEVICAFFFVPKTQRMAIDKVSRIEFMVGIFTSQKR